MKYVKTFEEYVNEFINEARGPMSILSDLDDWIHDSIKRGNRSEVEQIISSMETAIKLYKKKYKI